MGLTRKGRFVREYEDAATRTRGNISYIIVAVKLLTGSIEIITNASSLDEKLEYYRTAYDKDLKLETNPHIQIVDWMIV